MCAKRKPDEEFFIEKVMAYFHGVIGEIATQIPEGD
jgi:hypothetical protein